jgi:hypothetical protein
VGAPPCATAGKHLVTDGASPGPVRCQGWGPGRTPRRPPYKRGRGSERRATSLGGSGNRTRAGRCETPSRIAPLPRNRPECLGVDVPPRSTLSRPVPGHSAGSCDICATWAGAPTSDPAPTPTQGGGSDCVRSPLLGSHSRPAIFPVSCWNGEPSAGERSSSALCDKKISPRRIEVVNGYRP